MKRLFSIIILVLTLGMLCACRGGDDDKTADEGGFKMIAEIKLVGEKIEVNVIEAEYAEGIYLIITSDITDFVDSNGKRIGKGDLAEGDTVEITYNGQVMMSLPPQVAATKIVKRV